MISELHSNIGTLAAIACLLCTGIAAAADSLDDQISAVYLNVEPLYQDLHRNPELSLHEHNTAATLAGQLRSLGYDVTTGVGGTGVVGVLRNGAGPVVMLRTELDALPIRELTQATYASTVQTKDDSGADVGVMHACGHDIHMAAWVGTASIMARGRDSWTGTLVLIAQPAEELAKGAAAMIADGLFTRFPRPDFVLAVHDDPRLPAGTIGYHAGAVLSNIDTLKITIFGRGGHGAQPEVTVDPIVIAARTVITLQTIVARETSPFDSAVVTVGAIHGGSKSNIIPDTVTLDLTVRSLTPGVRLHLLSAIERIVKAEAAAGNAPRDPLIERSEGANALINDPALTQRIAAALKRELGDAKVTDVPPEMASEDFSEYSRSGLPVLMLRIGATEQSKHEASMKSGVPVPPLHSALFLPDREPTIKAAIAAEVIALRELMAPARQ